MKIVQRRGDESGAEMKLGIVEKDGRMFVYFQKPGTDKAQLNGPHFIAASGIVFGDLELAVYHMNQNFSEFVNPAFADGEELKQLRAESAELRGAAVDPKELEQLRAGSVELERLREEGRERVRLRARLAELQSQDDAA